MADFLHLLLVVLSFAELVISDEAVENNDAMKKEISVYPLTEASQIQRRNNLESTIDGGHFESQEIPLKEGEEAPVVERIEFENPEAPLRPIEVLSGYTDYLVWREVIKQTDEDNKGFEREFLDQKRDGIKDKQAYQVYKREAYPRLIACHLIDRYSLKLSTTFCSTSCYIEDHHVIEEPFWLAGCSDEIHPTGFAHENTKRIYFCNEDMCNKVSVLRPWKSITASSS